MNDDRITTDTITARKTGRELLERLQIGVSEALDFCAESGNPLNLMIAESLKENFIETFRAISNYVPKQRQVDIDVTAQKLVDMSDAELMRIASEGAKIINQEVENV